MTLQEIQAAQQLAAELRAEAGRRAHPDNLPQLSGLIPVTGEARKNMTPLTTTLSALQKSRACAPRYRLLVNSLGGLAYGKDRPITLLQLLDICGLNDALWALRACDPEPERDRFSRELACDYAARALSIWDKKFPEDQRPAQAIEVARRFARGEATKKELDTARDASRAAEIAALGTAAEAAARAATRAAETWAAEIALQSPAAAARAVATRVAEELASEEIAAWDVALDTAWEAEVQWQTDYLRRLLTEIPCSAAPDS